MGESENVLENLPVAGGDDMSPLSPLRVILSAVALGACTSPVSSNNIQEDTEASAEAIQQRSSVDQLIVAQDRDYITPQAVTAGTLRQQKGCLIFDNGSNLFTTIWPTGSKISNISPLAVEIPNGRPRLPLGSEISLGGGEVPRSTALSLTLSMPIPAGCPKLIFLVG